MKAAALVLPAAVAGSITVSATPLASQPVLNFVGVTAHSWGTWVAPGTDLEDWLDEARGYCEGEDVCDVQVFEGAELATHEYPVPEANRPALRWVFEYRHDGDPRIVVTEAPAEPGDEPRRLTYP